MALPLVAGFVSGITAFFRPFLTKIFKALFGKVMIGFAALFDLIWSYVKVFFDRLPFYLLWLGAFYILFRLFAEGALALITSLDMVMPASIALAATWFLPDNIPSLLSIVYGSKLYRFVYDHKMIAMKARLTALVK